MMMMSGGRKDLHDPHAYVLEHIQREDAYHDKQRQKEQQQKQQKKQKVIETPIVQPLPLVPVTPLQPQADTTHFDKVDKVMQLIYYKNLNFDGIDTLYKKVKLTNKDISKDDVSNWLKQQDVYQKTIERPKIQPVENLPIYANDPYSFQIDLTFLPKYKEENDDNYVLFTAININTRYSYASYGKDKKGPTIIKMLDDFLKNALIINSITSDSGSEFTSGASSEWFEKHKIKTFFWTGDSHRLGIINRFHRTLKQKLLKYMVATDSTRWIDIMDKLIDNLNNTFNRGIGMTPMDASNPLLTSQIINDAINKTVKIHREEPSFEVGDYVRVLKKKQIFGKQDTNYSDDVLKIIKVYKNTVSLVNMSGDKEEYNNVKKKWLLKISTPYIKIEEGTQGNKKAVEENHRITQKVKKSGVERNDDQTELVSAVKGRVRKQKEIYDV
jgi:hypothetical protein